MRKSSKLKIAIDVYADIAYKSRTTKQRNNKTMTDMPVQNRDGKWVQPLRWMRAGPPGFIATAALLPGDGGEETQKAGRVVRELWARDNSIGQIRDLTGFDFFLSGDDCGL